VGPPLEGVTWQAFAYRDGPIDDKQAVVPVVEGSTITVEFDGAETLSGSSGCNTYTATYSVAGTDFHIGALLSTRRDCRPALMAQERAYLDALRSVAGWKFSGPAFQLLNESGTVEATYVPA
jgi:heat shock protein HslJ